MNGLWHHLGVSLRLHLRNRMALVYGYLFPLIFLVAFWVLYRFEKIPISRHLGELLTVSVLGGACFGLPTAMVSERERGVWRRYRLAPVPTWSVVLSTIVARYVIVLTAGLRATGLLPDEEEAFDLGSVGITLRWADITQPTNVVVEFSGGIGDFLKVKAQELLSLLRELRDVTDELGEAVPAELRSGLSSVIGILEALDSSMGELGAGGSATAPSFQTVQDFAAGIAYRLNQSLGGRSVA